MKSVYSAVAMVLRENYAISTYIRELEAELAPGVIH